MEIDDPNVPQFGSPRSYERFARRVRRERRYATDGASRAFISTVLATAPHRATMVNKNTTLYRAQIGIDHHEWTDDQGATRIDIVGFGRDRMIPKPELVLGGRANPAGIAYLYLATSELTAISEVRPWIGVEVSVAQFQVKRDLRSLDLTKGHGQFGIAMLTFDQLMGKAPVDPELRRRAVWTDIDGAFSRPVSRTEELVDYVPTQVLAEAFREAGYEAIVYRSNFGNPGYNVVLFNVEDAEIRSCAPHAIKTLSVEAEQCGNPWFVKSKPKRKGSSNH